MTSPTGLYWLTSQGSPDVLEFWKKLQKLYKKYTCKKYPKLYSKHPFWSTWMPWGGLQGSKSSRGGDRAFPTPDEIFSKIPWLCFGHKNILRGVVRVIFDFTLLSPHPIIGKASRIQWLQWCHYGLWRWYTGNTHKIILASTSPIVQFSKICIDLTTNVR